jgi:hypothetical protein
MKVESLSGKILAEYGEFLEEGDMMSSLESTVRDFEQAVVNATSDDNICQP